MHTTSSASTPGADGRNVKARSTLISTPAPPNGLLDNSNNTTTTTTMHIGSAEKSDEAADMAEVAASLPVHATATSPIDMTVVYHNLWLFIWLKTIGSHDSGAFSAAVAASNGIAENWGLSYAQQGTLTSSVFLGNVLGCPLAGHLFSAYGERNVLTGSLIVHTVFTFLFAIFSNYYVALVNRFFIGLTLAFIVVYTPVWVDEFAPKERQSVWMASHNAGVPLGIMMGYLLAAFFPTYTSIGWEWAFYIKCVLMIPTILYVMKVDPRTINTNKKRAQDHGLADQADHDSDIGMNGSHEVGGETILVGAGSHSGFTGAINSWWGRVVYGCRSLWQSLVPILTNVIFMCSVLAMSSLYFVATGLQNFVTQYLREDPFNASMRTIMAGFGASVVTAPVCGVVVGGILLDRIGGYQRNLFRVSLFACAWGAGAALAAIICIFVKTTTGFLLVMSLLLFCGGAIIPPGLGLTMSTLPPHLRSMAAAFSQTLYNLLGNFSGPLVCGQVAEWTGELKYGIMVLLLSSVLGLIPMAVIFAIAWRARRAVGPALDVPDAVAVVSTSSAVDFGRDAYHTAPTASSHQMKSESIMRLDRNEYGEEEPLEFGPPRPVSQANAAPFVRRGPAGAAVMPPGHAQLSDGPASRWSRGVVTRAIATPAAASATADHTAAHFSPLKEVTASTLAEPGVPATVAANNNKTTTSTHGESGPAGAAVTSGFTLADMAFATPHAQATSPSHGGERGTANSFTGSTAGPDVAEESSQVMQTMTTPYLFGMDVVRNLLHPVQMPLPLAGEGGGEHPSLASSQIRRPRSEPAASQTSRASPSEAAAGELSPP